jgi:hypothetical protein
VSIWLDILSPALKSWHEEWVRIRGTRQMPTFRGYPLFGETVPSEFSICVTVPKEGPASFLFVGTKVRQALRPCRAGTILGSAVATKDMAPISVSAPIYKVIRSREPDSRRIKQDASQGATYESLLLPFGEMVGGVRIIHGIFDFTDHAGAFR